MGAEATGLHRVGLRGNVLLIHEAGTQRLLAERTPALVWAPPDVIELSGREHTQAQQRETNSNQAEQTAARSERSRLIGFFKGCRIERSDC